jgi:hypothetical protein
MLGCWQPAKPTANIPNPYFEKDLTARISIIRLPQVAEMNTPRLVDVDETH